jgi:hypothetical protein
MTALGLLAFGFFAFLEARYRTLPTAEVVED